MSVGRGAAMFAGALGGAEGKEGQGVSKHSAGRGVSGERGRRFVPVVFQSVLNMN